MRALNTTPRGASSVGDRRRPWSSRRAVLLGLVPAAAIAAACGSSSTNSGGTSSTNSATTNTSGASAPAVKTANNPKFGTILVDDQGRTLYTFTNNGAAAPCNTACLAVWPPSLLPTGQTKVSTGPGVTNVTAVNANGGMQLAYKGLPLYRFSGDPTAGATNGQGLKTFGGLWQVVVVSGGAPGAPAPGGGTATTGGGGSTTTTSGGGYSGGGY